MRQIKLTMRDGATDLFGGQRGEHRMATLQIPLPTERLREIKSCIAVFSCDNELVLSPLILPGKSGEYYISGKTVHVILWQRPALTSSTAQSFPSRCCSRNPSRILWRTSPMPPTSPTPSRSCWPPCTATAT